MSGFNGLGMNLGNLARLSKAKSRSISAENPTGAKGKGAMAEPAPDGPARLLGRSWKCRPYVMLEPGQTATLADIEGPGAIQSLWFSGDTGDSSRDDILRIYWEDQDQPSVECPLTDFFATPWPAAPKNPGVPLKAARSGGPFAQVNALPVAVNPNLGLNCFWEMPFRKRCRITMENRHPTRPHLYHHQINYTLTEVPDDAAYFHAQFRRVNPVPTGEVYTILDSVHGQGHYVGVSMGWGVNTNGWWGEGEIKFYIDGDDEFPTICGTGTEDYFGGGAGWIVDDAYATYSTPFLGMQQVIKPDGFSKVEHRHSLYRFHVMDPVRFERDLRVTMQVLGWQAHRESDGIGEAYLPGHDDVSSACFWYQTLPTAPFPELPERVFLTNL